MAERPLNPDEAALWRRVVETVRPTAGRVAMAAMPTAEPPKPLSQAVRKAAVRKTLPAAPSPPRRAETLDGSWDRSLGKGAVVPDRTIDLHGHSLDRAYGRIDRALEDALAAGERVVLLVTGRLGGERAGDPVRTRGAIRAVVGDWLAASRHAGRIAAVRPAHPRHGGAGALYVILRRAPR